MLKLRRVMPAVAAVAVSISMLIHGAAPAAADEGPPAQQAQTESQPQNAATGGIVPANPDKMVVTPSSSATQATLPASADLRQYAVPVGNQGSIASCVTWAIDYAMLGMYNKSAGRGTLAFAPMYTYSQIGTSATSGSSPVDALNKAVSEGNDIHPHYSRQSDIDWQNKPNAADRANAANYKIVGYNSLAEASTYNTWGDRIKDNLSHGKPVAMLMYIRPGFRALFNDHTAAGKDDDVANAREAQAHEVLVVGYDSVGAIIQNSWGTNWANGGFGRVTWRVINTDFIVGHTIKGLAPAPQQKDTTAPVITTPMQSLTPGTVLGSNTVPMTVSWSASDNSGSVASNELWTSTNGGAYTQQTLASATATSKSFTLSMGSRYQFVVRARDAAGNYSPWNYGPTFVAGNFPETSSAITYSGVWTSAAWSAADGGYVKMASTAKASATIKFTGRNLAWVASKGNNRGQAYVYLDGQYATTIDLYSASGVGKAVVATFNSATSGTHTLQVVNVATSGRPTIDVDSFIVVS